MHDEDDLVAAWRALATGSRRRRDVEAEDHVQDAVVAALDVRRRTGRAPDAAGAWLRTVARRREVDHVRRAQCERRVVASGAGAGLGESAYDAAADVLDRHEARWLAGHVEQLPATTRSVVHALASGATQADVAGRLGLTPRAVEGHVRRARLALRRALERAGAVIGVLLPRRRRRRLAPVAAAGVAAAVGVSLLGTGGPDRLVPLPTPRPPRIESADVPRIPDGPRAVAAGPVPAWHPGAPVVVAPRPAGPASPGPSVPPSPDPGPVAPAPAGTDLVVLNAKGDKQSTDHATEPGVWYDITAAGTYSYNGRPTGLADCGHYVPEGATGWSRYDALVVDGAASPCGTMPLDTLHRYTWRQRGTGRPMTFHVKDDGGGTDNLGSIVVTVTKVTGE